MTKIKKYIISSVVIFVAILVAWFFLNRWAKGLKPNVGEEEHFYVSLVNIAVIPAEIGAVLGRLVGQFSFNEKTRQKHRDESNELLEDINSNLAEAKYALNDNFDDIEYEYDALSTEENQILLDYKKSVEKILTDIEEIKII